MAPDASPRGLTRRSLRSALQQRPALLEKCRTQVGSVDALIEPKVWPERNLFLLQHEIIPHERGRGTVNGLHESVNFTCNIDIRIPQDPSREIRPQFSIVSSAAIRNRALN